MGWDETGIPVPGCKIPGVYRDWDEFSGISGIWDPSRSGADRILLIKNIESLQVQTKICKYVPFLKENDPYKKTKLKILVFFHLKSMNVLFLSF